MTMSGWKPAVSLINTHTCMHNACIQPISSTQNVILFMDNLQILTNVLQAQMTAMTKPYVWTQMGHLNASVFGHTVWTPGMLAMGIVWWMVGFWGALIMRRWLCRFWHRRSYFVLPHLLNTLLIGCPVCYPYRIQIPEFSWKFVRIYSSLHYTGRLFEFCITWLNVRLCFNTFYLWFLYFWFVAVI